MKLAFALRAHLVRLALAFAGLTAVLALAPATDQPVGWKVMTFNIQHGIDRSHKYNLQRAIDTIARVQPDLVGLQEVTRNHPYYNCDDQPARIAEGLKAATGRCRLYLCDPSMPCWMLKVITFHPTG